ncbi:MAG: DUF1302 family protein [Terriglobales bacterium]
MQVLLTTSIALATWVLFATPSLVAQESKTDNTEPQLTASNTDAGPAETEATSPSVATTESTADQASTGSNVKFSWDTTFKYSNAFRLSGRNARLIDAARNPFNLNQDDGDRNFHGGLVSNRVDVLSEMDVQFGDFGIRGSMAAWGDSVYNQRTANNSPQSYNSLYSDYRHFPGGTRDLQFAYAELLDAFFFGKTRIGDRTLSFRVGKFAQLWGEALFFGNNGIAGGMSPIDVTKLLAVPNTQFKELIRPVPQVSLQFEVTPKLSIGAYYQFLWDELRLPPAGSYYSALDFMADGGERVFLGPPLVPGGGPAAMFRRPDLEPKDSGQFGVQAKIHAGHGIDLGFYAIQFHEKAPQPYLQPFAPGDVNPVTGQVGNYYWVFPENIKAYGMSATKTMGVVNWAIEISGRTNQDLTSLAGAGPLPPSHGNPSYAVGDSIHGNLSALATFGQNFLSKESTLLAEIAWNRLLSISHNPQALDPGVTRDGVGFRLLYTPTYRQVFSGLDLSIPVGFSFFPMGKSAVLYPFGPDKGGDFSVGVSTSYLDAWRFSLTYTQFYGPAGGALIVDSFPAPHFTFKQSLADRNTISFSIFRTIGIRNKGSH